MSNNLILKNVLLKLHFILLHIKRLHLSLVLLTCRVLSLKITESRHNAIIFKRIFCFKEKKIILDNIHNSFLNYMKK